MICMVQSQFSMICSVKLGLGFYELHFPGSLDISLLLGSLVEAQKGGWKAEGREGISVLFSSFWTPPGFGSLWVLLTFPAPDMSSLFRGELWVTWGPPMNSKVLIASSLLLSQDWGW